jgi:hypothetical protein
LLGDSKPNNDEITIDEFFSVSLKVKDYTITFMDAPLTVGGNIIKVAKVKDGRVG